MRTVGDVDVAARELLPREQVLARAAGKLSAQQKARRNGKGAKAQRGKSAKEPLPRGRAAKGPAKRAQKNPLLFVLSGRAASGFEQNEAGVLIAVRGGEGGEVGEGVRAERAVPEAAAGRVV